MYFPLRMVIKFDPLEIDQLLHVYYLVFCSPNDGNNVGYEKKALTSTSLG